MKKILLTLLSLVIAMIGHSQIIPKSLHQGSNIAIVTPASYMDSLRIDTGLEALRELGFNPVLTKHVYHHGIGSYTASDSARAADIMAAFADPSIDAIMCCRGGYGSTRLLPYLDFETIINNPKWLIGFSDISALHAFMYKAGVASIHGPMLGHLGKHIDDESTAYLMQMLVNGLPMAYRFEPGSYDKPGRATGRLVGGNFIVVSNLAETPYDVMNIGDEEDIILFVEEVGEKIYAVERLLLRLHQSGALANLKGIIFGEFTDYKPDEDFDSMEQMIYTWLHEWGYYDKDDMPIMYCFPGGHDEVNYPLPMGAVTTLEVTPEEITVTFSD